MDSSIESGMTGETVDPATMSFVMKLATLFMKARRLAEDTDKYEKVVSEIKRTIENVSTIRGVEVFEELEPTGDVFLGRIDTDGDGEVDASCVTVNRSVLEYWIENPDKAAEELDKILEYVRELQEKLETNLARARTVLALLKTLGEP